MQKEMLWLELEGAGGFSKALELARSCLALPHKHTLPCSIKRACEAVCRNQNQGTKKGVVTLKQASILLSQRMITP